MIVSLRASIATSVAIFFARPGGASWFAFIQASNAACVRKLLIFFRSGMTGAITSN